MELVGHSSLFKYQHTGRNADEDDDRIIMSEERKQMRRIKETPLLTAAKLGVTEMLEKIPDAFPSAIQDLDVGEGVDVMQPLNFIDFQLVKGVDVMQLLLPIQLSWLNREAPVGEHTRNAREGGQQVAEGEGGIVLSGGSPSGDGGFSHVDGHPRRTPIKNRHASSRTSSVQGLHGGTVPVGDLAAC